MGSGFCRSNSGSANAVADLFGFGNDAEEEAARRRRRNAISALAAVGLPDFMAWFVGPTTRTGEGTPNGSGFTLPNFRTAISNAVTTMANVDIAYVDSAGYVSVGNRPDGLHFNPAGHIEYEAAMRLVLGY